MTVSTWHRECYKFPNWAHKIGYGDGFARSHWMSNREECQAGIDATIARGGEAFMESFIYPPKETA